MHLIESCAELHEKSHVHEQNELLWDCVGDAVDWGASDPTEGVKSFYHSLWIYGGVWFIVWISWFSLNQSLLSRIPYLWWMSFVLQTLINILLALISQKLMLPSLLDVISQSEKGSKYVLLYLEPREMNNRRRSSKP